MAILSSPGKSNGKLYLIPNTLGRTPGNNTIPEFVLSTVRSLDVLIVENIQTTRKYLQWIGYTVPEYEIQFFVLNKHTPPEEVVDYLKPALNGKNIGVISEAGCPGVADPGSIVVTMAHRFGIQVIPLVGPNSILLALMASGFNGQSFSFWGYLPIDPQKRREKIAEFELQSLRFNQTQIFIETPHRNMDLLYDMFSTCRKSTFLCTATDLTLPTEQIISQSIEHWPQHINDLDLSKRPTIFLLYAADNSGDMRSKKNRKKRKK